MDHAETSLTVTKAENTKFIKCSNCSKQLMRISNQKIGPDLLFNLVVNCPFCKDKSFIEPIYGPLNYIPADKVKIKDTKTDGNKITFLTCKGD